ncbi:MAG: NAD-glutamate dehydrogenase [Gammaproteobacteria bacterium]|nr:NAD-glutamate dehydrogenase [Gammaproteobacteria bacterium]
MSTQPNVDNLLFVPIYQEIKKKFSKAKADSVVLFASQLFASSSRSELAKFTEQELLESVMDAWQFVQERKLGSPSVKFFQRKLDKHENRQTGTSIYILVDDMPFLVDSIRQCLNRNGVIIRNANNAVFQVNRIAKGKNTAGKLKNITTHTNAGYKGEALSCINCAFITDIQCRVIEKEIRDTLRHVAVAVKDFQPMCSKAIEIREALLANRKLIPVTDEEMKESSEFLSWLVDNHFTFLGYEEYRIKRPKRGALIELQKKSMLGISRYKKDLKERVSLRSLPKGIGDLILKKTICSFAKSTNRSKVHRPAFYDYVIIKEFDDKGSVIVEHRFVGLYTSSVYYRAALDIPLVRKKVNAVLDQSGFAPNGHSIKDLLQVINVFPRDELFQISKDQLYNTALEITQIQETRASKLFIRKDSYGKFFSCLAYIPRDIYNTRVRINIQEFLEKELKGEEVEFTTYFSESTLARIHFILRVPNIQKVKYDLSMLNEKMVAVAKPWEDYFLEALQHQYLDQEAERLHRIYADCYSSAYKEVYSAEEAVKDIARIDSVVANKSLALDLDTCSSEVGAELSFKIFSYQHQLFLSDVAPVLENLGLNIISEKAFKLEPECEHEVWLHDFSLYRKNASVGNLTVALKQNFEEAFNAIWSKKIDDDNFNALVVMAGINWRDAALLRAYAAYLKQIQFGYTPKFMAETLAEHKTIAGQLIQYFYTLFDPDLSAKTRKQAMTLKRTLSAAIDVVANLAEDSVLRAFLNLFDATLRTNYFQPDTEGNVKDYFSFKLAPEQIEGIPLPKPKFEIFVFSRGVEGVHLRGGRVARGGLRWSDRSEDYRTEVLGLVKAQQVKNSVIVPVGAKGGFYVKESAPDREAFMRLGIASYKTFISGLLDITDNIIDSKLIPPVAVVRRDEDDPYLVVAADKGTTTFSDIANEIAGEYEFWLGDGFASGGSNGYDHKAMGITARGAWVSVQRHFREIGVNVQEEDFTVVGIGDMSGDVFGNGMLLSKHICLTAAFNHMHIFIDPNPDSARSYRERLRLFKKPRSSWADYNPKLISRGGGVFPRTAKSISLSPEIKARFAIGQDSVTPDEFISLILRSPVDLIWNGGIGTYIKASNENHSDVGDKANDMLRVNGSDLRCKIIGEGGNLGLTQAARVEFGLHKGVSLTDFIDNSAGVDCSDHEVNIKILLNKLQADKRLSTTRRNKLLESMTGDVSELVLANNYSQVQAIGIAYTQMDIRNKEYADLISYLEKNAGLDRALEFLPSEEQLEERTAKELDLTRPEISVVTSYMKMFLKAQLTDIDYIGEAYLLPYLYSAFPEKLVKSYAKDIHEHPLRNEIIATQLSNSVVNLLGPSFIYRMVDSTASTVGEVIKATIIAKDIFQVEKTWSQIESLDYKIGADIQAEMMSQLIRLVRRVTRWLLRNRRSELCFETEVTFFIQKMSQMRRMLPGKLPPDFRQMFEEKMKYLVDHNVSLGLATEICRCDFLFSATSFIEISKDSGERLSTVVDIYYSLGEQLQLNWLGKIINHLSVANYWQALARETYLDDLAWQQRALTCNVVSSKQGSSNAKAMVNNWVANNQEVIMRTSSMLAQLQAESRPDYSMFSVALRELLNLAQSTAHNK